MKKREARIKGILSALAACFALATLGLLLGSGQTDRLAMALVTVVISSAPMVVPSIEPAPPNIDVPPMMTDAMAFIS